MDNSSSVVENRTILSEPGFAAFGLSLHLIILAAVALSVLTTCSLCCKLTIPRAIAAFLICQLIFGILKGFVAELICLVSLILVLDSSLDPPPELLCKFMLWGYRFAAVGQIWSLMAFCIVTLVTAKQGIKVFKRVHIVLGVVGVLVAAFIINIYIILPHPMYAVQYVDNVACFPNNAAIPLASRIPTLTVWLLFGGMIPIIASIIIPIITLCYIKRNTITKDAEYSKKIARFAFFLAASNMGDIIDFLGGTLQGLIVMYSQTSGVIFAYVLVAISLLPTPIVIIVFMKPVQEQLRKMFCFACNYRSQTYLMSKAKPSAGGDKSIHMTLLQK
jgi:hypothetical protein